MIKDILINEGLGSFVNDADKKVLVGILKADSLFYKRLLREMFYFKMCLFFNKDILKSSRLSEIIPRSRRMILVYELEAYVNVDFPKMKLSGIRALYFFLIFSIPLVIFLTLVANDSSFIVFSLWVLFVSNIVSFVVFFLCIIISPNVFSALDWADLVSLEDLLHDLAIRNSEDYSNDNFKLTIDEVTKILEMESRPTSQAFVGVPHQQTCE